MAASPKVTLDKNLLPRWWAHRGGGRAAPENTLKGFAAGADAGFRGVEFDVKLTRDNQAIVLHDDDLKRVAGVAKNARDLSFAEITKIDAGVLFPKFRPAYVPSFAEVAKFCLDRNIFANVEIKPCPGRDIETAEIVVRGALRLWQGAPLPPLFSSFSLASLKTAQKLFPQSFRGLLIEEWPETDAELLDQLADLGCVSAHLPDADLTKERVQSLLNAGYIILAWTVNDLGRARELLSWGVTGIITDLIDAVPNP